MVAEARKAHTGVWLAALATGLVSLAIAGILGGISLASRVSKLEAHREAEREATLDFRQLVREKLMELLVNQKALKVRNK